MPTVDDLISELDPKQRTLAKELRSIVKRASQVVESVKWESPNYSINGKNVACFMFR